MKKIVVFTFLSLFLFACGGDSEAEIGEYTTVEFDEIYEAGTVAKGEIVEAKIEIKNTGDYPLVIANVQAACSCTVSEYDEDPVAPGKSAFVSAEVDTDKTSKGVITKTVTISANTRPSTNTVTIKAKVID
ncbi:MAG: DUF1573 domain-containing protein [Brumimicrobium sp.]